MRYHSGSIRVQGVKGPLLLFVSAVLLVAVASSSATAAVRADTDPATAVGPVPVAAAWTWPVAGAPVVERPFQPPLTAYGPGHRGVDIAAEVGSTVVSPAAGVVLFAGPVAGRSIVTVDHGDGRVTSFDPVAAIRPVGTQVAAGDVVGVLEPGGHCSSGCLHLGLRIDGEYVDPLPLFARPRRAVLLPLSD